jgi:hypothetical protein
MAELSPALVVRIAGRIRDPGKRNDMRPGASLGVVTDPGEMAGMFEEAAPGSSHAFQMVIEQMKRWGQDMPPMHVTRNDDGMLAASTEDETSLPLAAPATEAAVARVEGLIGRPLPADLRQLYAIADGGWGPGTGYTAGHGTGFYSLESVANTLEDLRRRGPGYTGEAPWPEHLLPIADTTGPVSYNLDSGAIVAFNDYYYDDDLTIEAAFSTIYPALASWLEAWLDGNDRSMPVF